ncbi:high-affinity branched-chain amino acid ABC transporter permease LivM [Blastochloris sulfoviridis]|uniref:High-affinity branched-chain amino acid ABC transporter permease LivM n=1 Tax=Blastochloris sulfoviridis TaxID=50712 RepID=A0A5M6I3H2_9HYPH|nr:high-affinity branched-chain amino acid ABC transporter permease LivM [Blastochloris sulfoviridis]KAA5602712.1 high-affinity branched-chain amino acid ABC transporter permease LivM [Blastochloris sulfoviridis]
MKSDAATARADFAAALKDAAIAALIALGVTLPLVGFRTDQGPDYKLILTTRFDLVAVMVALVFAARLALTLWTGHRPHAAGSSAVLERLKPAGSALFRLAGPALLGLALVLPFLPVTGRYELDLGILILTYIMLGWGLNIVVGLAGLLDLGYVAFYAVGAYSFAIISTQVIPATLPALGPWAFWICLPIAGLLAAFWGIVLGFPVLRLRGDYLAIVTLAFGEIIRIVLLNWQDFSGGPNGIASIPRPTFFGLPFTPGKDGFAATFGLHFDPTHRIVFLYYVILMLALITAFVSTRLRRLPIGRAWEALREDEIACRSLGINTTNTKLTAFALGAMFGGFAGSFFATRQGFISPESFNFMESAMILAIVVLGGAGSLLGVVISAIAMVGGVEMLRNLEFLKSVFGPNFDPTQYRMLIFGLVMVLIMIWRPRGLIATRRPSIALKEKKTISSDLIQEGHG